MLERWLDYERATLARKCSGLGAEDVRRRAVPPSNLSLLGLLRHMTEVERGWFGRGLSGADRPPLYFTTETPDADFDDVDRQDPMDAYSRWTEACTESRVFASRIESLDTPAPGWSAKRTEPPPSLRWIMTHMIEEYARHNGHADLIRERIDGETGV